jgi:hypothetical protein
VKQLRFIDALRAAEQKDSARIERVMQQLDHVTLGIALEIDEHVPADDEVQVGIRWIRQQVVVSEDDTTCSVWNSGLPTHSLSLTDGVVSTACGRLGSNEL